MNSPTLRQRQVLHELLRQPQPTIRELCDTFRIRSTNGVNDHLKALERLGLIFRSARKSRSIVVTALGRRELGVRS